MKFSKCEKMFDRKKEITIKIKRNYMIPKNEIKLWHNWEKNTE